jgi:hypothetical protein
MGNFDLEGRRQYLTSDSSYHATFVKEQRFKYIKGNENFKNFDTVVKLMLEEDEYRRDTFRTLFMKIMKMEPHPFSMQVK